MIRWRIKRASLVCWWDCSTSYLFLQQMIANLETRNNPNLVSYCPEIQKTELDLTGLRSRCWQGHACVLSGDPGGECFLVLSSFRVHPHSVACDPFLHHQSQQHSCKSERFTHCCRLILASIITPPLLTLAITPLPPSFMYKNLCDDTGPTQIIQDNLPSQDQLISNLPPVSSIPSST